MPVGTDSCTTISTPWIRPGRRHKKRGFEATDVRDHLAPRRGEDDDDREAAPLWRGDPPRGVGQEVPGSPSDHERLDGDRAPARDLDLHERAPVRVRGPSHEPARHPRPQRLQRGHLSDPRRGRFGRHAHRQRQGRRTADDQALPGLSDAGRADHDVHQQDWTASADRRSSCSTRSRRCSGSPAPRSTGRWAPVRDSWASTIGSAARCCGSSAPTGGERRASLWTCGLDEPDSAGQPWRASATESCRRRSRCSTRAGAPFDLERFLAGQLSPVFFGSAMTNFGIEPFLDRFVELAPPPQPKAELGGDDRARESGASRASCSRSRRTWIRTTATASPSSASAPVGSLAGWRSTTFARAARSR